MNHYLSILIWVVCGLPAGGKSTIAKEMADTLGVQILQSDFVRKQLLGVPTDKPMDLPFESLDELQNDMHLKINTEESIDACMRQILSHDYFFLTQQTARAMKNLSL